MSLSVRIDTSSFIRELFNPRGPLGIDMLRRGNRVKTRARTLAPKATGKMANTIRVRLVRQGNRLTCYVESPQPYSIFQHDGTGIYGPRRRMIVARPGKVFVFRSSTTGDLVFTTRTRGVKPTKFLVRALPAAG